jgi:hypothetical protein
VQQVSKVEFKRMYDKHGSEGNGWTPGYWHEVLEPVADMTWHVAPPASSDQTRMLIVTDYQANEIRMVFLSEETEDAFFRGPEPL